MENKKKRKNVFSRLLALDVVLLIAIILTMPVIMNNTWAWGSEDADHIITYQSQKLRWSSNTDIRADGSAELTLFKSVYENEGASADGEKIVFPGSEGENRIRLINSDQHTVRYYAVLYEIKTNEDIPVRAVLSADASSQTTYHAVPAGVKETDIVESITGELPADAYRDFTVEWFWKFDEDDERDTALGNAEEIDDCTVGVYIVIDDESEIYPPQTADNFVFWLWIAVACILILLFVLLLRERRREED